MWDWIQHIQTQEPSVCYIHFDFFYCLTHASNSIKILDKRDLYEHDRIHTWAPVIRRIFFFYKIINKLPVDGFINQSEHMILRNHVIHAEDYHLFSFFIRIFRQHKNTAFLI